jgi:hypothetical protein
MSRSANPRVKIMDIAFFLLALIAAAALIEHMAWMRHTFNADLTDLLDEPEEIEHAVSNDVSTGVAKVEADVKKAL